mmetsp:Transcript_55214/g.139455  ORF Transcript_55214/g.139455 Transcript_55214/m.139455 type:complete len:230 (-) Transcript_55214:164-853(-)
MTSSRKRRPAGAATTTATSTSARLATTTPTASTGTLRIVPPQMRLTPSSRLRHLLGMLPRGLPPSAALPAAAGEAHPKGAPLPPGQGRSCRGGRPDRLLAKDRGVLWPRGWRPTSRRATRTTARRLWRAFRWSLQGSPRTEFEKKRASPSMKWRWSRRLGKNPGECSDDTTTSAPSRIAWARRRGSSTPPSRGSSSLSRARGKSSRSDAVLWRLGSARSCNSGRHPRHG